MIFFNLTIDIKSDTFKIFRKSAFKNQVILRIQIIRVNTSRQPSAQGFIDS